MDVNVYINGVLRTNLTAVRIVESFTQPCICELRYVDRHDSYPLRLYADVTVRRSDTLALLFSGNVTQMTPGGVAGEGIDYIAHGRRFRLANEPVRINGSTAYKWNDREYRSDHESGEDSPGMDGRKWTAGEILIDILEHALGYPGGVSDIPGHHSTPGCVTDTYLAMQDISGYNAADILALTTVIGEFQADNMMFDFAISELLASNGGFYGWYITPSGILRVVDLDTVPEDDIEAGELGHWQDEGGTDYVLLDNRLNWSLDGVYTSVTIQGEDETVEVKPSNLDSCANAALNGGGALELVAAPFKDYPNAYRAIDQPYRKWAVRGTGFEGSCEDWRNICECGIPGGLSGIRRGIPRVYKGTAAGAKTYVTRPGGGFNWAINYVTGIVSFYWDVEATLVGAEELWGWYWARRPFIVTAGPDGTAYDCLGYERVLWIFDRAFRAETSWPNPGEASEAADMALLAQRLLDQRKDIRIQGAVVCDDVDPVTYSLERRFNVTRLDPPTTTTAIGVTAACWPDPMDWAHLSLNVLEVAHNFDENTVEMTIGNTFWMLESYSELKRRLGLDQGWDTERDREWWPDDLTDTGDSPDIGTTFTPGPTTTAGPPPTTTTAAPGPTTTTTLGPSTSTTTNWCRDCSELSHLCYCPEWDHTGACCDGRNFQNRTALTV